MVNCDIDFCIQVNKDVSPGLLCQFYVLYKKYACKINRLYYMSLNSSFCNKNATCCRDRVEQK